MGALVWLRLSAVVIVLDQLSKWLIARHFELYQTQTLLPVFDLVHAHNRGVAFSFFSDGADWPRWVFSALAVAVSAALIVWLRRLPATTRLLPAALALIIGGALGNLVDRLRQGYVIDFIQVHWQQHYFPAFNVADSAITIGAGLLLLESYLASRRAQ
jgi:signal peptidase II